MKITRYSLAIFPVLVVIAFLAGADTTLAEGDKTHFPGWEVTLEQALQLKLDFIAVAKLVKFRDGDPPPLSSGTDIYGDVEFEIISALKGKASGTVRCLLFIDSNQPAGSKGLQENVRYIIFCKSVKSGVLVVLKMLPDDEKTERTILSSH